VRWNLIHWTNQPDAGIVDQYLAAKPAGGQRCANLRGGIKASEIERHTKSRWSKRIRQCGE
jgi:hypothetical protein